MDVTVDCCVWLTHADRERRDGDREFRGRDDGDDKTLGDWRRKEEPGGRDRRGMYVSYFVNLLIYCSQGDHLSGKPGNVREFDSCQRNVRHFTISQGSVREKPCQGKVVGVYSVLNIKYMVSDREVLHSYTHH